MDKIDVEESSFGNAMSDFNCNCVKLEDCGLYLTRLQSKNMKKTTSDQGLEKLELPVRTRKARKPVKKKDDKDQEKVEDAKTVKPVNIQPGEDTFPGIKQKITQVIKDKEQLYLQQRVKKHVS